MAGTLPHSVSNTLIAPRTFQDVWYPVCVSSAAFIIADFLCVTILIPSDWKKSFRNVAPLWSFYSSIFCQTTLMVPMGFVVFYEHGWDVCSLLRWDTQVPTSTFFAFVMIGYMVKDLWYCRTRIHLIFHHLGVILTNTWCLVEPGMPHSFFMFCTSVLEMGSLANNLVPFARTRKEEMLLNQLNILIFGVGHVLGLYWCYHLYFVSPTSFWFRNLIVLEGLGIMYVRHVLVFKRYHALLEEEMKVAEKKQS